MQNVKKLLKNFEEKDGWKEELVSSINEALENNKFKDNDYKEFLKNIADIYVAEDDPEKTKEELFNIINDEELLNTIHDFIMQIKKWFFDVKFLRSLQKIDPFLVNSVLNIIMEYFVIHIDDSCVKRIQSLIDGHDFEEECIRNCLGAIDYKAEIFACEFLSKAYISSEFSQDSGLDEICSNYFAELVIRYERDLKINYIVKRLKSVQ